jgi:hypothetical protein
MKTLRWAILLSVLVPTLCLTQSLFAYDEPDNFAGLKFGQDLTKQLPECKGPSQAAGNRCYQKGRLAADSRPGLRVRSCILLSDVSAGRNHGSSSQSGI